MQTEYISSGDCYVACAEHKLLKVLLGSCVGVAIYDAKANIGGIIHLLLPEPASPGSSWSPGSYASTGLPLFINNLLTAGAKKENLLAIVAGGALFGPISRQDLALNLGGRCIEKVHKILQDLQIPIIQEESCGFSPSILTLDTTTWQYRITTRFGPPAEIKAPPHKPDPREIADAIRTTTPIPQSAMKIINLISEDDYDAEDIARTIETDQVLAAKILSLCNSALFGSKRRIDSLEEAVLILGEGHLLQMVATASVDSLLAKCEGGYAMLKGGLYKHAIGVAHAAKLIAHDSGQAPPGVAYTAGLLHDIGKVVLDRYFVSFLPLFYQNQDQTDDDLIHLERHFLGTDHQQAGRLLATDWGLPESITQVVSHHHYPEQADSHQSLVHLVYVADLLTHWYLAGLEFERINSDDLKSRLEFLKMSASQLPGLIERVPWMRIQYL